MHQARLLTIMDDNASEDKLFIMKLNKGLCSQPELSNGPEFHKTSTRFRIYCRSHTCMTKQLPALIYLDLPYYLFSPYSENIDKLKE